MFLPCTSIISPRALTNHFQLPTVSAGSHRGRYLTIKQTSGSLADQELTKARGYGWSGLLGMMSWFSVQSLSITLVYD